MNTPSKVPRRHALFKTAAGVSTLAALLALAGTARAQSPEYDDFDSGILSASWSTITNPNYPNTITFARDIWGGNNIRMQGAVPGNCGNGDGWSTARCMAMNTDNVYTNFYVSADLVGWSTNANSNTNYEFAGVFARCTGSVTSGSNWSAVGLFYWTGVNTHNYNGVDLPAGCGVGLGYVANGFMDISTADIGAPVGAVGPSCIAYATLETGHSYRFVCQGVSSNLFGAVYDLQDLTTPILTLYGDTSIGSFGGGALVPPAPTYGYSGLGALAFAIDNNTCTKVADATFDNFYAAELPSSSVIPPGTTNGVIAAPQVVNRTPASWANFYNAAGGISFTATTLSTTNNITNAVLVLNGVNVSSGLSFGTALPTPTTTVSFNGLVTNQVYDASIILADQLGRQTTNFFTFDTFSAAYLASTTCQNIECEDYDIGGGPLENTTYPSGIPFPIPTPASGYSTNDNTWMIPPGATSALGYYAGINIAGGPAANFGYVGLNGVPDPTADGSGVGVDYYTPDRAAPLIGSPANLTSIISGGLGNVLNLLPGCEYRTGGAQSWPNFLGSSGGDYVGTERGAAYALSIVQIVNNGGNIFYDYAFDTKRQKYADLNAVGLSQYPNSGSPDYNPLSQFGATGADATPWWDVEEYNVIMTESGYWMNYTKPWGSVTNSWLVYLRNACAATETANFYLGATTNRANLLGTFSTANALRWNWRYTPLRDTNGNLKVVNLGTTGGGNQTLRLEIDPTQVQSPYVVDGLALNYLAFVPYLPGSLTVTITPSGAVTAGAQWQVDGGALQNSGNTVSSLTPGLHTISFTTVAGYTTPTTNYVNISASQTATVTGAYIALGPQLWSTAQIQKSGTAWTQETGAVLSTVNQTLTLPTLPTANRYYHLVGSVQYKITKVQKVGSTVVFTYQ